MVFSVAHGGAYFVGNGNLKGMDPTQRQVLEARAVVEVLKRQERFQLFFLFRNSSENVYLKRY